MCKIKWLQKYKGHYIKTESKTIKKSNIFIDKNKSYLNCFLLERMQQSHHLTYFLHEVEKTFSGSCLKEPCITEITAPELLLQFQKQPEIT